MRRGSLRHYSSHGRRSSIAWDTALVFVLGAIALNFLGLYLTHRALIATFEPYEEPEPEPLAFGYVDPSEIGEPIPLPDDGEGERPDDDNQDGALDEPDEPATPNEPAKPANRRESAPDDPPEAEGRPDANDDQGSDDQELGSDDGLVSAPDGELPSTGPNAGGGRFGKPDPLANIGGSPSVLDQTFGPPPQADRARDKDEEGVSSVLDNREQLYRSFFGRIRRRVEEHWNPQGVTDRVDPAGSKYGTSPRTTVLMAHIDSSGKVTKVVIIKASGFPELDEEAVRTLKAASPFPNPPSGLFDERGYIEHFFGFTVTRDGRPRFYRYNP